MIKYIRGVRIFPNRRKLTRKRVWNIAWDIAEGKTIKASAIDNEVSYSTANKVTLRHMKKTETWEVNLHHPDQLEFTF